ncbi:MAG: hypothetical protein NUV91_06000, partial [Candidatus Omnitrophica bacterium]|nr:hypothetical protein [Candidatus Omnitrophota bacterium]
MKNKLPYLLLLLIVGIILLHPQLSYQSFLSTGDHGRDLYAAEATMHGARPYHDYWWVYGPLMPYYYALTFKIFSVSIPSILLAKMLLKLLSGFLIFSILSLYTPLLFSFLGSLWFWAFQEDFFFTYNHEGGLFLFLMATLCLLKYFQTQKEKYLYGALLSAYLLALVKINFGVGLLLFSPLCVFFFDWTQKLPFTRAKRIFYIINVVTLFL